ncbi:MAG: M28 family peptidase, partial [Gemmatimonadetes bacterium]|nr:M28 family peptidase [Gemmatimonadota bacterium]
MSDGILKASLRALSPGAFLFPFLAVLLVPSLAAGDEEARLRRTVETLSAPASRMTGYPGAAVAREWLVAELESLGIAEIYRHEFPVLVPIDEGFWLECAGERLELFGVWPNLVRTPTLPAEGIEGQLVYGGDGSRLEGQPVAGRIVLLDYVSGTAWVDAFHLGAAAVVFLESAGAHRKEAQQKFLDVPADLPRLYARRDVAERLRVLEESRAQVRLRGRMVWREVTAQNLVAVIPGRDATLGEEVVFLAAHYDAVSPVPALAPGAEQAASAAGLLELARGFAERPPKRTVALLWTAGHFQNMAGMRHFAPLLLAAAGQREGEVEETALLRRLSALKMRFLVGLDLSSHSPRLGAFRPKEPYRVSLLAPPITERLLKLVTAYEDSALGGKRVLVNGLKQDFARQGLGGMGLTVPLDASVAALTGCPALAFCTVNDSRARFDAPDDDPAVVRFDWLGDQVALLQGVLPAL